MQAALKLYLSHSFKVIAREQEQAAGMVKRLEPKTRESLIRHFGDANAWRGLPRDDLQTSYDIMKAFEMSLEAKVPPETRDAPGQIQPTSAQ
jgi:hypothetical protein